MKKYTLKESFLWTKINRLELENAYLRVIVHRLMASRVEDDTERLIEMEREQERPEPTQEQIEMVEIIAQGMRGGV